MDALKELAAYAPILYSANYSLGIAVCKRLLQILSTTPLADWDIEVIETHHNRKADAPSGTAKLLVEALDPQHGLQPVYGREGLCGPRKRGRSASIPCGAAPLPASTQWRFSGRTKSLN